VPEPDQKNGQRRETDPVSGVKRRTRHQLDHGVDQAQENHSKYDHNHCDPDCLACDISHASRLYLRQGELARTSVDVAPRPLRWTTQTAEFALGVFCGVVLWSIFIHRMFVFGVNDHFPF
jgi:hypothetical protein